MKLPPNLAITPIRGDDPPDVRHDVREDVLMICGTRPAIIKLAPLYHALRREPWATVTWLHSGQHADMAQQMLDCFDIVPDIRLERQGASLFEFSQGCRAQLEAVVSRRRWSMIIVQGDTEDAFLGALAGFYHQIPVVHVEAGLRTRNLLRPFPEEGLRRMIGRITTLHLAPTARARASLLAEDVADESICVTGNTVIDAQHWVVARHGVGRRTADRGHLLVTLHRRENWGDDVEDVCRAIADLALRDPSQQVLFPVHLNPVVHEPVHRLLGGIANVRLTAPLDYLQMQQALADAWLVLTDSGGLQEEAPTFEVPLLVLRDETERPEALERGCARLIGTDRDRIVATVEALRADPGDYEAMQRAGNPFGDGRACARIVARLRQMLAIADDPNPFVPLAPLNPLASTEAAAMTAGRATVQS